MTVHMKVILITVGLLVLLLLGMALADWWMAPYMPTVTHCPPGFGGDLDPNRPGLQLRCP